MTLEGRCLCGRVRFALESPTDFCSHCHCESCRRAHGAPMVTWTSVPVDRFKWTAGRKWVTRFESSSDVFRSFCSRCGSPLIYDCGAAPDKIYVAVAQLTAPLDRVPENHVSFEERVPWFRFSDALPKFLGKTDTPIEDS